MSLIVKSNAAELSNADLAKHLLPRTDGLGTLPGGAKGYFDFSLIGDDLAVDEYVDNIVPGQPQGQSESTFTGMTVANGLPYVHNVIRKFRLGDGFNLRKMGNGTDGTGANALVSCWLTLSSTGASTSTSDAIAGYAHAASPHCQWGFTVNSANNGVGLRMNNQYEYANFDAHLDTPKLLSVLAKDNGDGTFAIEFRLDDTLLNTKSSSYPFVDPTEGGGSGVVPKIGKLTGGFTDGFAGTVHDLLAMEVPPYFDVDRWIAAQLTADHAWLS